MNSPSPRRPLVWEPLIKAAALLFLLHPLSVEAAPSDSIKVEVRHPEEPVPLSTFDVYAGEGVPMSLAVEGPQGGKTEFRAERFLLSRSLAAPLKEQPEATQSLDFTRTTAMRLDWVVPLPEELHRGKLLVQFSAKSADGKEWYPTGKALIRVHSIADMRQRGEAIQKAMAESGLHLKIHGEGKQTKPLLEALQNLGVNLEDAGNLPDQAEEESIHLWLPAQEKGNEPSRQFQSLKEVSGRVIVIVTSAPTETCNIIWKSASRIASIKRTKAIDLTTPVQMEWLLSQLELMTDGKTERLF